MIEKLERLFKEYKSTLKHLQNNSYTDDETWECGYAVAEQEMLSEVISDIEDILSAPKKDI